MYTRSRAWTVHSAIARCSKVRLVPPLTKRIFRRQRVGSPHQLITIQGVWLRRDVEARRRRGAGKVVLRAAKDCGRAVLTCMGLQVSHSENAQPGLAARTATACGCFRCRAGGGCVVVACSARPARAVREGPVLTWILWACSSLLWSRASRACRELVLLRRCAQRPVVGREHGRWRMLARTAPCPSLLPLTLPHSERHRP